MSLPLPEYVTDPVRNTGEMKTVMSDMIGQIKKGVGVDYLSTTTYLDGEVVATSNDVIYTSQIESNLNNNPISDDGTNWKASPYLNYKGEYSDLSGSFSSGMSLSRNGNLWQAVADISDITLSTPNGSNTNFIRISGGIFDFVVSQYADGDESEVIEIDSGVDVSLYAYFIYKPDSRLYFNSDGATGTFSGDFDPDTGVDSGLSGALVKYDYLSSFDFIKKTATETDTGVQREATQAEVDSRSGEGFVIASKLPTSKGFVREEILGVGTYGNGVYTYPNSRQESDYEIIEFKGFQINTNTWIGNCEISKEAIQGTVGNWKSNSFSGSDIGYVIEKTSATSFQISIGSLGTYLVGQVVGYLKDGVT